jgi:hypothetical protein
MQYQAPHNRTTYPQLQLNNPHFLTKSNLSIQSIQQVTPPKFSNKYGQYGINFIYKSIQQVTPPKFQNESDLDRNIKQVEVKKQYIDEILTLAGKLACFFIARSCMNFIRK